MAGNIIPAIATTNAIIAGVIVLQALHVLRHSFSLSLNASASTSTPFKTTQTSQEPLTKTLRNMNIQSKPAVPLAASRIVPPNQNCAVCRDAYTSIRCNPSLTTLREVIEGISGESDNEGTGTRDVSVFEAARLLADPDFDDNLDKTLESLGVSRGKFLTIVDEEGEWGNLSIALCDLE